MEERRRFVRLNVLTDIVYNKQFYNASRKLSISKDISKGGICIIAYEELKESDILDLKILLPDNNAHIVATGRVVWTKEFIIESAEKLHRYDVGIEFMEISEEDREKINKYVFTHLK